VAKNDARLRLAPAKALGVLVRNLAVRHGPIYAIGEWAATYDPALLGLGEDEVGALNDDRLGRMLSRLFDADRATLLTGVMLHMVATFGIDCTQLHNDSTSITLSGVDYPGGGSERSNKTVPRPAFGHNKDFRPDLLQLVWVLTISADGAVPIAYRIVIGGPIEIEVGDDRVLGTHRGLSLEGIRNLHEDSMVTNLVLDEQVDQITESLRRGLPCSCAVSLEQSALRLHVLRQVGVEIPLPDGWPRTRLVRHIGHRRSLSVGNGAIHRPPVPPMRSLSELYDNLNSDAPGRATA
jgi:hypothetical protein